MVIVTFETLCNLKPSGFNNIIPLLFRKHSWMFSGCIFVNFLCAAAWEGKSERMLRRLKLSRSALWFKELRKVQPEDKEFSVWENVTKFARGGFCVLWSNGQLTTQEVKSKHFLTVILNIERQTIQTEQMRLFGVSLWRILRDGRGFSFSKHQTKSSTE